MNKIDILIIGAGAAGLMAARTLAKAGKKVIVLEARNRCGGRIHTIHNQAFLKNTELGAEFIHGNLPVTLNLLKEAGIAYQSVNAEMWRYNNGHLSNVGFFITDWGVLIQRLSKLEADVNMGEFLQREFPGDRYKELRESVRKFVSGYDTADLWKASAFALRREWQGEDDDAQRRVKGGYGAVIKYLEDECKNNRGRIYLNSIVKEVHWSHEGVKAITTEGVVYDASQILIALPLGVLQAYNDERGAIAFHPEIPEQKKAIEAMGFGAVIKILLEFDSIFWEDQFVTELAGKSLRNMGYLFSDEEIPTWWTQSPQHSSVLTGWLGGPDAANKKNQPDEAILQQALQSLGKIFKRNPDELKNGLLAFTIVNWTAEPFTRGSYSFDTVASEESRKLLNKPLSDILFFAGDYLYDGPAMGTVEAALTSGQRVAKTMLSV
ncbi:MAG TPA: NAD(P)/FAD-dependent oxidoreductase [Mucilaginibacter sp.]|jgi:monoamine oxidase